MINGKHEGARLVSPINYYLDNYIFCKYVIWLGPLEALLLSAW